MLFIGLYAMILPDSSRTTMSPLGRFGLTHCSAAPDYSASADMCKTPGALHGRCVFTSGRVLQGGLNQPSFKKETKKDQKVLLQPICICNESDP